MEQVGPEQVGPEQIAVLAGLVVSAVVSLAPEGLGATRSTTMIRTAAAAARSAARATDPEGVDGGR